MGIVERQMYHQYSPRATVGVDATGDGRANYMVSGADRNFDGIPDVLQGGGMPRTLNGNPSVYGLAHAMPYVPDFRAHMPMPQPAPVHIPDSRVPMLESDLHALSAERDLQVAALETELCGVDRERVNLREELTFSSDQVQHLSHELQRNQTRAAKDIEERDSLHTKLHERGLDLAKTVTMKEIIQADLERTALQSADLQGQLQVTSDVVDHERQEKNDVLEQLCVTQVGLGQTQVEKAVVISQLEASASSAAALSSKLGKAEIVLTHERMAKGKLVHELAVSTNSVTMKAIENEVLSGELQIATKNASDLSGALHQAENTVCHERAEKTALASELYDTKLGLAQQQASSISLAKELRNTQLEAVAEHAQFSAAQIELDGIKRGLAAQSEESRELSRQLLSASSVVSSEMAAKSGLVIELEASQARVKLLAAQAEELRNELLDEATHRASEKAARAASAVELDLTKQGLQAMAFENENWRQRCLEAETQATIQMAAKASALTELGNAKREIALLAAENESTTKRLLEAESMINSLKSENTVLEAEVTTAMGDLATNTKRMHEAELNIASEQNAKALVLLELDSARQDNAVMQAHNGDLTRQLEEEQQAGEQLLEDLSTVQADLVMRQRGHHTQHLQMILWHQNQMRKSGTDAVNMRERSLVSDAFAAIQSAADAPDTSPQELLKPKARKASAVKQAAYH